MKRLMIVLTMFAFVGAAVIAIPDADAHNRHGKKYRAKQGLHKGWYKSKKGKKADKAEMRKQWKKRKHMKYGASSLPPASDAPRYGDRAPAAAGTAAAKNNGAGAVSDANTNTNGAAASSRVKTK